MSYSTIPSHSEPLPLDLTIRAGMKLVYNTTQMTPITLLLKPRLDVWQYISKEQFILEPRVASTEYEDHHGNIVLRMNLPPGQTTVIRDTLVSVPSMPDNYGANDIPLPPEELPANLLRYTLPSRYCESDKLMAFSAEKFAHVPQGLERVKAICNWVHQNIEYRFGSGDPTIGAAETLRRGYGVCRDFAHLSIALCRTFNIPTRYVTGYLPDVGFEDPGTPMDFHAYFQVYIGHRWHTYDARFNVPRIGRIQIACGNDAVDGAFATIYGNAQLSYFEVWAYQCDPLEVDVGTPVDLSKRLDGTTELRFPHPESVI